MSESAADLYVVPADRHVERLAREGHRAESRGALRARLASALLPELAFADARECRLILGIAFLDGAKAAPRPGQMDLFARVRDPSGAPLVPGAPGGQGDDDDPLLATARSRGGTTSARMVAALDEAVGALRARGVDAATLRRVGQRATGIAAARARALATAVEALDARLASIGAVDARCTGALLAEAIGRRTGDELAKLIGARRLRARWLFAWDPADLAWWRVLDERLSRCGGWARVQLPTFDRPLEGARDRDPLEELTEEVARGLDAAPESEPISAVLGHLTGRGPRDAGAEVAIVRAPNAVAQARAVVRRVTDALAGGARVERVAIAVPFPDDATLTPLRRALDDAGVIAFDGRGGLPSRAPVVVAALDALSVGASLDRRAVARFLRSGYVDAGRFIEAEPRERERALARLAHALESSATAAGADPAERLLRTAEAGGADPELTRRVVDAFVRSRGARTRNQRLRAARELWIDFGVGARAGRGGLRSFATDAPPEGVARAERIAIARDSRAWDLLVAALDFQERTVQRLGAGEQIIDDETFRLEIADVLDVTSSLPGAGRAGAVRIARLRDFAGEELDALVIVDANDGVLPRDETRDALVSESLWAALARESRGRIVAPAPGSARARELAALAVAAADSRAVVLTFSREDASGAPLAPSSIVDALARSGVSVTDVEAEGAPPVGAETARRAASERAREAFFLDPARPRSAIVGSLTPEPELVALLTAETGGENRALSVTGLERFARCPFMGYAYVVLGARKVEMRDELPDAREEGTLVHEALAAAFGATRAHWPKRPRDAELITREGLAAADAILAASEGHAPLRFVARIRVRDAVRAVLRAAIDDFEWDFAFAEQTFGMAGPEREDSWPALDLRDGSAVLSLRGTMDRVDRSPSGRAVRVVDYKRSKSTVRDASSALGETAIQVPLYACVASLRLGAPATGLYMPTQPRDVSSALRPNPRNEQRMTDLVARVPADALAPVERTALALVASVRAGNLTPLPGDEKECRTCDVSGGCRKPRFAMAPADDVEEAT